MQNKTEGTIGKTVMAVFASIFIGLGILFFAMQIFPDLSDVAKLAVIYVVCAAFSVSGTLLLVFLNPNSKAFLTISLCGAGLMYIAFFVSHYVFDIVPAGVMLFLVLLWSGFCALFAKEYTIAYQIISMVLVWGMFVTEAIYFNAFSYPAAGMNNAGFLVTIDLVFYCLILLLSFVVTKDRAYHKNLPNFVAVAIAVIPLIGFAAIGSRIWEHAEHVSAVFLLLMMLAAMIFSVTFFRVDERKSVGFGICQSVYTIAVYGAIASLMPDFYKWQRISEYAIGFVLALAWLIVIEIRFHGTLSAGTWIWQITELTLLGGFAFAVDDEIEAPVMVCLLAIGALLYGYRTRNKCYKITGLVYGCVFMLQVLLQNEVCHALLGVLLLTVAGLLMFLRKEQYHAWCKVVFFFAVQWIIMEDIGTLFDELFGMYAPLSPMADVLQLTIMAAVTYVFAKLPSLNKHPLTWEKEQALLIATGIYNIFLMLAVTFSILDANRIGFAIAYIIIGAAIFGMNAWKLLKYENAPWPALYIGIKWFVFVLAAASGLGAEGIGMSIVALFYSLVCISAGFFLQNRLNRNYQNVRILGLVFVFLSLLKLLMYDVYYSSNLIRAIGFFVAGMLCFAISMVYHLIEKKMKESERNYNWK